MRIHRHRRRRPKPQEPRYRANEKIKADKVRVINENKENLGVLDIDKALEVARERGFDLVEVSPTAKPPVCKLLDFGQFKYRKEKEARKQRAQSEKVEIKGIRLSVRIGDHDLEVRRKQAVRFLKKGNKVQVELRLRGREKAHKNVAREVIQKFLDQLREDYELKMEQPIKYQGGRMTTIVARAD